ncbi:MAG: hypothetical protein CVT74_14090 [Alphaproteobacteria bacterium HGW-Alphaproteobacteria-13]|nr:MAG: hypothetical protein CVT74_14090 [Alphaproteobacteria bacterium HGW-Alphaproteobacteria-13]
MSDEIDLAGEFEWDDMIDRVVDLIPAKMTPRECRELRENVHNSLWASIGDLFDKATIEIRRSRGTESEIRLWMTVGPDCVDFQKGFNTKELVAKAYSKECLTLARDILTARIEEMQREKTV